MQAHEMRRLDEHGVFGLKRRIQFSKHIGYGADVHDARGVHPALKGAFGNVAGKLAYADQLIESVGRCCLADATMARLRILSQFAHVT